MVGFSFKDQAFLAAAAGRKFLAIDDVESYADSAGVDGLNAGLGWRDSFVARMIAIRVEPIGITDLDDIESYLDGAGLNGLDGGSGWDEGGWGSAYAARTKAI